MKTPDVLEGSFTPPEELGILRAVLTTIIEQENKPALELFSQRYRWKLWRWIKHGEPLLAHIALMTVRKLDEAMLINA